MTLRQIRRAVIPAAGNGTRCLPATKAVPKEMLSVVDRPIIQYAVEEALASGIEQVVLVTSKGKGAIEDHFDRNLELENLLDNTGKSALSNKLRTAALGNGRLTVVRQHEPLGLGHAIWCARNAIGDEAFAVILPDDLVLHQMPCLAQMLSAYQETGGNVVAVESVPRAATSLYGVLDVTGDDGRLARARGLVEKPAPEAAPSTLAIVGRYVLQPEVMTALNDQRVGAGGEIQLTDALAHTISDQTLHGFRFAGLRFDCGNPVGYLEANLAFALARPDIAQEMRRRISSLRARMAELQPIAA